MASKHTIHLADGDDARRHALARVLRARGFDVLEFARGSELFERALAAPPDLIVSTLDLDVMDGFQVVESLRRRRPEIHGRVVFLSRAADPVLEQACALRGARACLDGAAPIDSLVAAIEAAFLPGPPAGRPEVGAARPAMVDDSPTAETPALPSAAWGAPATPERASRSARERAAIAALRERWHARDGKAESPGAATLKAAPRRARVAALAVLGLLFCAGFGLAVLRSPGLPALVERLGRLRAQAAEKAVQAVRAPVQASRAATEAREPTGEAPGPAGLAGSSEASPALERVADARSLRARASVRPPARDAEGAARPAPAAAEIVTPRPARGSEPVPSIATVPVQPMAVDPPTAPAADLPTGPGRAPAYSLTAIRDRPQFVYVDVQPALRVPLRPSYPRALADRRIGGAVTLWVLVSETGRVEDVRVLRSSGHPELDRAASNALRLAAYAPARRDGVAVPTWTRQQVAFRLD